MAWLEGYSGRLVHFLRKRRNGPGTERVGLELGLGPVPCTRKRNCRGKADMVMDPPGYECSGFPQPLPSFKGTGSSERANPKLEVIQVIELGVGSGNSWRKRDLGWTAQNEWTCLQLWVTLVRPTSLSGLQWKTQPAQSSLSWGKGEKLAGTRLSAPCCLPTGSVTC